MRTMPYALITWTGEEVDQNFADTQAQLPDGQEPLDPDSQLETAYLHLVNGFGVLFVYGRFYQGGSIVNDVNDMIAGLKYLEQESLADNSRIAVTGFSWGGFEAVYGACCAPSSIKPLVGTACFPVTDMKKWYDYTGYPEDYITGQEKINEYNSFFSPYLERIRAYTGGSSRNPDADFSWFNHDDLGRNLDTDFLIAHNSRDTLVPINLSKDFYQAHKDKISPLWFYHDSPVDFETAPLSHDDLLAEGYTIPAWHTIAFLFMYKKLAGAGQNFAVVYQEEAMEGFIRYVKEYKQKGYDMEWAAARFLDFFDERAIFWKLDGPESRTGSELITTLINNTWGSSYTAAELEETLHKGLPHL